jgi:AraC family transcriptional regulator
MIAMPTTTLHIKNMVCPRCISVVGSTLRGLGLPVEEVRLGEAVVQSAEVDWVLIDSQLRKSGFELIFDKEGQMVEHLKAALLSYVAYLETPARLVSNLSSYLSDQFSTSYSSLSKTFSHTEHTTLEKYLILLKIERVKELLSYNELTLSEIAFRLRYSSVQALSNQFKKVTGLSVSEFRQQTAFHRKSLDALHKEAQ